MKVSLKTIAEALSLSKATVSWIISGKGEEKGFSEATIKLVKEYADKVGYRPNLLARSLSTGSTNIIALIIPAIDDTFYSQMIKAVEAKCHKLGYTLVIGSSERDAKKQDQVMDTLIAQQVDGVIIAPVAEWSSSIAQRAPIVSIDRYIEATKCSYVVVENRGCSSELVQKIVERSARKVAIITSDTDLPVMGHRLDGYRTAVEELAIDADPTLIVEVERAAYTIDIEQKLDALLKDHPDCDGLFFTTHYLALEAIRYFRSHKIDYENRFKMGCFHTTTALDILAPEMIFSIMPVEEMCHKAVEILVETIANRELRKEVVLRNTIL